MSLPVSTYRLQITSSFDLDDAAAVLDYVAELGADWLYLSPLLTAETGSDHGYDVVDHGAVDPARGGPAALARLSERAVAAGRGILVDIVPNHMGVQTPKDNGWWWDLLMNGQDSRYAEAFDIDWPAGKGRLLLPVLGDGDGQLDELTIVGEELRYYDNSFPLAPGTADDGADPVTVHGRQHYELVNWRQADAHLNYRRFFAVNTLAGIRVEVPWVFDESHREILRWVHSGQVQGLRVDHPDGLADPGGYLDRLRAEMGGGYLLVEKILEGREQLPTNWSTDGTTGYDALADFDRVLVDPAGQDRLDALEADLQTERSGESAPVSWAELVYTGKRAIADGILQSEIRRLDRLIPEVPGTEDALAELISWFPVYRSYLPVGRHELDAAVRLARSRRPDLDDTITALLPYLTDPTHPAAVRFQQTSGMVMAKGVEDTAYYRYSRLTSLNEVGADPSEFAVSVDEFHQRQQTRQAVVPASQTTLSTHDTKRGEDVRARITVLAEMPEAWAAVLADLRALAPLGDAPFENLLWQAIVGSWPASTDRLIGYAEKASREANLSTTWTAPNEEFEDRMRALVRSLATDGPLTSVLTSFVDTVEQSGWSNSLALKLIQLTAPGVPDVYQGSELWEMSLVDPDNRRPVDYAVRRDFLHRINGGWLPPIDSTGAAKLLITTRALRLRRDRPELFHRHAPVEAFGQAAAHVVAYDRGGAVTVATRLPVGLARTGWADTTIILAGHRWVDVLTGATFDGGEVRLAELLDRYPVALLIDAGDAPDASTTHASRTHASRTEEGTS